MATEDEKLKATLSLEGNIVGAEPKALNPEDKLFAAGTDWWHNACLNFMSDHSDIYASGYLKAATVLADYVIDKKESLDSLIYPIAFNYRQYLELRLKQLIAMLVEMDDQPDGPKLTHDINGLWATFSVLAERLYPAATPPEQLKLLASLIDEFAAVDPTSQGFRYANDRQGNRSLEGLALVNVANLRGVMAKIADRLDFYHTGLCGDLDFLRDARAER